MKTEKLLCQIIEGILHDRMMDISTITLEQWEDIYILCYEQDIDAFVYDALEPVWDDDFKQTRLFLEWRQSSLTMIFQNKIQYQSAKKALSKVFGDMEYIVLKGPTLRRFYRNPDVRFCSDIDILVKDKNHKWIRDRFEELGYVFNKEKETESHHCYDLEDKLSIEVHDKLTTAYWINTDQFPVDVLFEHKEPFVEMENSYALDRDENMIYLLLHGTKHVVHSALGIKQLIDIVLFVENNAVDWVKVNKMLDLLGIKNASMCLMKLCVKYLGMECELENDIEDAYVDFLLESLLRNGVFGQVEDADSNEIMSIYLNQYGTDSRAVVLRKIIFKPLSEMKEIYEILRYAPFLLPLMWFLRGIELFVRYAGKKNVKKGITRHEFVSFMKGV